MNQVQVFALESKLGKIHAAIGPDGLLALSLPKAGKKGLRRVLAKRAPGAKLNSVEAQATKAGRQLADYLAGRSTTLDVELDLDGLPDFTTRVLKVVRDIAPGETMTYGQVATAAGSPKAARAVGQVMHNNPIPLFVPCHRVVGADGSLTGFGGGLKLKAALLGLEGCQV